MQEIHRYGRQVLDEPASNNRTNDQGKEDGEQEEVKDSKANDSSLTQFGLLERVDWRTNLTTAMKLAASMSLLRRDLSIPWSEPKQHH